MELRESQCRHLQSPLLHLLESYLCHFRHIHSINSVVAMNSDSYYFAALCPYTKCLNLFPQAPYLRHSPHPM